MGEAAEARSKFPWWLAVLTGAALICFLPFACSLDPESVLDKVPIGSKYADLDALLAAYEFDERGEYLYDHERNARLGYDPVTSERAPEQPSDTFTGEVRFLLSTQGIRDDVFPTYMFGFYYRNGVLVKKNWGRLPG